MSFPRYPDYKDSGVEWLGKVPAHWEVLRLGILSESIQTGPFGSQLHSDDYVEDATPIINPSNIRDGRLLPDWSCTVSDDIVTRLHQHKLVPGDIVFARRGEMGRCAMVSQNEAGWLCGTGSLNVRLNSRAVSAFVSIFLRTLHVRELLKLESVGSTMDNLNTTILARVHVPVPPPAEQIVIAAFLDREAAKIDALVAEQQRLIELLKEKRQALISHAVTQGLDPTVPMKDSGVEWLGKVPAHWRTVPMKHLVTLQSGGTPSKENREYWDGDLPWASAKDMKVEFLADTQDHITQYALEQGAAVLLNPDTVIVVVRGMILARMFPVTLTRVPMAINQDLKAVIAGPELNPEFLAWYLRGTADQSLERLDEAGHGTKALRMDAWTSLEIATPPLTEQTAIAAILDRETAQLDALSAEAERGTTLLQERRSALISAAVTGQIDVRGFAAKEAA